ncbi:MAG: peptidylprolyl isomerase [Clostridia bacterium]|nr:peptidylprolyl isomerase [Clostridia bacterium]
MFGKTLKKLTCCALATIGAVACAGTMTACESSHPEVQIQIEFNDTTYKLNYKLYRKVAPSTVEHFLWLADNGYYDGLCVHDYDAKDARLYTGAYTYSAEESLYGGLTYKKYYDVIQTYSDYDKFPTSVWANKNKTNALYTLVGEFKDNAFTVESNALKEEFGSLTMYYTAKTVDDNVYVPYQKKDKKGEMRRVAYKYNSATSMFYISMTETEKTNNAYCTFATLKGGSVDDLEELQQAINDYIAANYDETENFTARESVIVDKDDVFIGDRTSTASYDIPQEPIIIKSVKVKKY